MLFSADHLFIAATYLVGPFWLLLALAPGSRAARIFVHSGLVSCALAILYIGCLTQGSSNMSVESFSTLGNLQLAFQSEWVLLAGWVHYLAFDLLIGAAIAREHQVQGGSKLILGLKLFFTLMLGPIGFLLHKIMTLKKIKVEL